MPDLHWGREALGPTERRVIIRNWRAITAAALLALGLAGSAAQPASAAPQKLLTARGCNVVIFPWQPDIGACINVLGTGTHVTAIKAGVTVRRGTRTYGYFHIYDTEPRARLNFATNGVLHCPPQGKNSPRTCWEGRWHSVNRDLPLRSQVCVLFVAVVGRGHHTTQFGPACKTIS